MKTFLTILILLIASYTNNSYAKETFLCTHPQLCNLASELFLSQNAPRFKLLKGLESINPHHFTPPINVYKTLKKSEGTLFSAIEIEPWFKSYENKNVKSFRVKLNKKMRSLGTPNQVAHFWLHPVLLCEVEKQLRSHFEKFNYKLKAPTSLYCTNFKSLEKLETTIVITHDALLPWLKSTSSNVLLINVHDDHHEMTPSQMKKLVKEVNKSSSVHWIIETQFHHPPSLERLISKNHKVIRINTTGLTKQKAGSILKTLNTFLKD